MESFQSYSRGTGKGHTAYCCPVSGVEYGDFNNITTTWVRTLNLTLYLTQCCLSVQNNNTDSRQAGHSHLSPVTAAHQLSTSYDIFELRIQPGSALAAGKKKKAHWLLGSDTCRLSRCRSVFLLQTRAGGMFSRTEPSSPPAILRSLNGWKF